MPKRDRDTDEDEQVTVKEEPGIDAGAPRDLQEAKEMLKTALDQAAQLAAEKAETEAKLAAEKEERQKEKAALEAHFAAVEAQRTIERVHTLFTSNKDGEGRMMSAQLVPNPNLLNIIEKGGTELSWTQDHGSSWETGPDYAWYYLPVDSWTKVVEYFENGVPEDLNITRSVYNWPKFDAVANITVLKEIGGDSTLVVGALTYRCTDKFRHHLYKEKYKKETERLWPQEEESSLGNDLALEGGFSVPTSLDPAIAAAPFDATIRNVFLPTDDSRTAGAHFDLNMDKMVAIKEGSGEKTPLFTWYDRYHYGKTICQKMEWS